MFCSNCGKEIDNEAVVCPMCGVAKKNFNAAQNNQNQTPQVVINNTNTNANVNKNDNDNVNVDVATVGKKRNKWIAFFLCVCLGWLGAHKFYEGKIAMGILYLFTCGLFFFGVIIDAILLLLKPNPYYV